MSHICILNLNGFCFQCGQYRIVNIPRSRAFSPSARCLNCHVNDQDIGEYCKYCYAVLKHTPQAAQYSNVSHFVKRCKTCNSKLLNGNTSGYCNVRCSNGGNVMCKQCHINPKHTDGYCLVCFGSKHNNRSRISNASHFPSTPYVPRYY